MEGTEVKPFVVVDEIETYPEEAESLVQGCRGVGHSADEICLALDVRAIVSKESFVELSLAEGLRICEGLFQNVYSLGTR